MSAILRFVVDSPTHRASGSSDSTSGSEQKNQNEQSDHVKQTDNHADTVLASFSSSSLKKRTWNEYSDQQVVDDSSSTGPNNIRLNNVDSTSSDTLSRLNRVMSPAITLAAHALATSSTPHLHTTFPTPQQLPIASGVDGGLFSPVGKRGRASKSNKASKMTPVVAAAAALLAPPSTASTSGASSSYRNFPIPGLNESLYPSTTLSSPHNSTSTQSDMVSISSQPMGFATPNPPGQHTSLGFNAADNNTCITPDESDRYPKSSSTPPGNTPGGPSAPRILGVADFYEDEAGEEERQYSSSASGGQRGLGSSSRQSGAEGGGIRGMTAMTGLANVSIVGGGTGSGSGTATPRVENLPVVTDLTGIISAKGKGDLGGKARGSRRKDLPTHNLTLGSLNIPDNVTLHYLTRPSSQHLVFTLREIDDKIIRMPKVREDLPMNSEYHIPFGSTEANARVTVRHACSCLKIQIFPASEAEIALFKQCGALGRRAPSASIMSGAEVIRLMEAFGRPTQAQAFREELMKRFDASLLGEPLPIDPSVLNIERDKKMKREQRKEVLKQDTPAAGDEEATEGGESEDGGEGGGRSGRRGKSSGDGSVKGGDGEGGEEVTESETGEEERGRGWGRSRRKRQAPAALGELGLVGMGKQVNRSPRAKQSTPFGQRGRPRGTRERKDGDEMKNQRGLVGSLREGSRGKRGRGKESVYDDDEKPSAFGVLLQGGGVERGRRRRGNRRASSISKGVGLKQHILREVALAETQEQREYLLDMLQDVENRLKRLERDDSEDDATEIGDDDAYDEFDPDELEREVDRFIGNGWTDDWGSVGYQGSKGNIYDDGQWDGMYDYPDDYDEEGDTEEDIRWASQTQGLSPTSDIVSQSMRSSPAQSPPVSDDTTILGKIIGGLTAKTEQATISPSEPAQEIRGLEPSVVVVNANGDDEEEEGGGQSQVEPSSKRRRISPTSTIESNSIDLTGDAFIHPKVQPKSESIAELDTELPKVSGGISGMTATLISSSTEQHGERIEGMPAGAKTEDQGEIPRSETKEEDEGAMEDVDAVLDTGDPAYVTRRRSSITNEDDEIVRLPGGVRMRGRGARWILARMQQAREGATARRNAEPRRGGPGYGRWRWRRHGAESGADQYEAWGSNQHSAGHPLSQGHARGVFSPPGARTSSRNTLASPHGSFSTPVLGSPRDAPSSQMPSPIPGGVSTYSSIPPPSRSYEAAEQLANTFQPSLLFAGPPRSSFLDGSGLVMNMNGQSLSGMSSPIRRSRRQHSEYRGKDRNAYGVPNVYVNWYDHPMVQQMMADLVRSTVKREFSKLTDTKEQATQEKGETKVSTTESKETTAVSSSGENATSVGTGDKTSNDVNKDTPANHVDQDKASDTSSSIAVPQSTLSSRSDQPLPTPSVQTLSVQATSLPSSPRPSPQQVEMAMGMSEPWLHWMSRPNHSYAGHHPHHSPHHFPHHSHHPHYPLSHHPYHGPHHPYHPYHHTASPFLPTSSFPTFSTFTPTHQTSNLLNHSSALASSFPTTRFASSLNRPSVPPTGPFQSSSLLSRLTESSTASNSSLPLPIPRVDVATISTLSPPASLANTVLRHPVTALGNLLSSSTLLPHISGPPVLSQNKATTDPATVGISSAQPTAAATQTNILTMSSTISPPTPSSSSSTPSASSSSSVPTISMSCKNCGRSAHIPALALGAKAGLTEAMDSPTKGPTLLSSASSSSSSSGNTSANAVTHTHQHCDVCPLGVDQSISHSSHPMCHALCHILHNVIQCVPNLPNAVQYAHSLQPSLSDQNK